MGFWVVALYGTPLQNVTVRTDPSLCIAVSATIDPASDVTLDSTAPIRGELTPERFECLLQQLASDRAEAAERYNRIRSRLIQFLTWERCDDPAHLADEAINRVARRVAEGATISNLTGYFLGVARLVAREGHDRHARRLRVLGELARQGRTIAAAEDHPSVEPQEAALRCLERCMRGLDPERKQQLLAYYTGETTARIVQRKRLAVELALRPTALRNRMLRLRERLERCVHSCMTAGPRRDGSTPRAIEDEACAPLESPSASGGHHE